jgi:hypothetical protein
VLGDLFQDGKSMVLISRDHPYMASEYVLVYIVSELGWEANERRFSLVTKKAWGDVSTLLGGGISKSAHVCCLGNLLG